MTSFTCDKSYETDLEKYTKESLVTNGIESPTAQREIMVLADRGNAVAAKLYADMVFYRKLLRKRPYRDAFRLYLRAADITVEEGEWKCGGKGYPLAFFSLGYYLVNYRRDSFLKDCESIEEIEDLPREKSLSVALSLAASCIRYVNAPAAVNLIGRILKEASEEQELFEQINPVIEALSKESEETEGQPALHKYESRGGCAKAADAFFEEAAREGYVYACNNLAVREAERIITAAKCGADEKEQKERVERYIHYLTLSADRYEPYAANRLGMFYRECEVKTPEGSAVFPDYRDTAKAKEYFQKATVYPDANSAWAYLNLIQFYHRDYDHDLDLLNEHMDYIKELNDEVYGIAMDL